MPEVDSLNVPVSSLIEGQETEVFKIGTMRSLKDIFISTKTVVNRNIRTPSEVYQKLYLIGEGSFGSVIKVKHLLTGSIRAMKIINKESLVDGSDCDAFLQEINILRSLDHPNVIKIFEYFSDDFFIYVVTEFCPTSLSERFKESEKMHEDIVRSVMKQIISAITYLHFKKIIHGDIKLENILCNYGNKIEIKVIDFGCSQFIRNGDKLQFLSGTTYYMAPEVIKENWDEKSDIWSCGVLMYILLTGSFPFKGIEEEQIANNILSHNYKIRQNEFAGVSAEAIDLIIKMLEYDPKIRIKAKDCLSHPFFVKGREKTAVQAKKDINDVFEKLKDYNQVEKFKQCILAWLVHNLASDNEVDKAKKMFALFDRNNDGRISSKELQAAYEKYGNLADSTNLFKIASENLGQKGYIEFEEFLRATVDKEALINEKNLQYLFKELDTGKTGELNTEQISKLICGENKMAKELVEKVMMEVNKSNEDTLTFEDLKEIMMDNKTAYKRYKSVIT